MTTSVVNYWAILVAGLAQFALGAIWYARPVFGKAWMQAIGKSEEQLKAEFSPMKMIWPFIVSLVQAYGVARIISYTMFDSIPDGILMGLLMSTCLILPAMGINDIMEGRPAKLTWINVLYQIVGFIVMGIIIGAWN